MKIFDPAENTEICVYGPPEYFSEHASDNTGDIAEEAPTFFEKILAILQKIIDFIKGLFN